MTREEAFDSSEKVWNEGALADRRRIVKNHGEAEVVAECTFRQLPPAIRIALLDKVVNVAS